MSMKKFKKLLAVILTGAMMLGSMSMTAFGAAETQTTQTTTPAVIDTTKTGSLIIHKYEYNENEVTTGTGSQNDVVPDGAKPLQGAGFTIYKVKTADEMETYYNTTPEALPDVNVFVTDGMIKDDYKANASAEVKTNVDGIAEFKGLELGFYVVIETTKPAAVTEVMAPFIVSVPMTTVNGADWLYDVHVFPKNGTAYGKVKLTKTGEDGSTPLENVVFALQKKNGENSWIDITKESSGGLDNAGDVLTLTTNVSGEISVENLTPGTYRFIETSVGTNNGYIMDGASAYTFEVTDEGKITYNGATAETATIPVSNEKPDLDKEVNAKADGTGDWQEAADYNVGDMVPYKVTVNVPNNIEKLRYFVVTDTPTGLKDDINTIKIKCGETTLKEDADYTVSPDSNGFKITFIDAADNKTISETFKGCADQNIEITYKAELLSSAVTTTDGNPNNASLEYSNTILPDGDTDPDNPNVPKNPTEPGKDSIKDETVVYTFKINVHKVDEKESPLKDVEFDLYKETTEGAKEAISGDDAKAAGLDTRKYWVKINEVSLKTNDQGNIEVSGLANGTYKLVETKTNEGYNLLKTPVDVTLSIQYQTTWTETTEWTTNSDGTKTITKHEVSKKNETFAGTDGTTTTDDVDASNGTDGLEEQKVVNRKGFTLPTTGGMGTVIFTVVGIILAFAGIMLITASRRKAAK